MTVPHRTLGTLLRHLIELLDGAVEQRYAEAGLDYRPRYTPVLRALLVLETGSIKAIAEQAGLTHSAASQTVAQMAKAGLTRVAPGIDGRERVVTLTEAAQAMLPRLLQLWSATNAAADALDAELAHPLTAVLEQAIAALGREPFAARIARHEGEFE